MRIGFTRAQPGFGISPQKLAKNVFGRLGRYYEEVCVFDCLSDLGHEGREVQVSFHDLLEHGFSVAGVEWRQARDHFKEEGPQ